MKQNCSSSAVNARCTVINHTPSCSCDIGYTGDPFTNCVLKQGESFTIVFIIFGALYEVNLSLTRLTAYNT